MNATRCLLTVTTALSFLIADAPAQTAQTQSPTDATFMVNWTHRNGRWFAYFLPNDDWAAVETGHGIDITAPVGDEGASFAFASGPQNLRQVENLVFAGLQVGNARILGRQGATGNYGVETLEFTGLRNGVRVHGMIAAQANQTNFSSYVILAPEEKWKQDAISLALIRRHITYLGRDTWGWYPTF